MSAVPTRILLAVHGGEPAGWGAETRQTLAMWSRPWIRILAVLAVPCPPFTSLIPPAARRYRAARAAWQDAEEKRVQRGDRRAHAGAAGRARRSRGPPVVLWRSRPRHRRARPRVGVPTSLLMAATPSPGLWLGAVHDRVVRHARCPVLLTPAPGAGRRGLSRWPSSFRSPSTGGSTRVFVTGVLVLLALDLGVFRREAREMRFREAVVWCAVWVSLALAFNAALYVYARWRFPRDPRLTALPGFDPEAAAWQVALEFLTGYVVEYSLSVDNIFVFVLVLRLLRASRRATSTACSSTASSARSSSGRSSSRWARC